MMAIFVGKHLQGVLVYLFGYHAECTSFGKIMHSDCALICYSYLFSQKFHNASWEIWRKNVEEQSWRHGVCKNENQQGIYIGDGYDGKNQRKYDMRPTEARLHRDNQKRVIDGSKVETKHMIYQRPSLQRKVQWCQSLVMLETLSGSLSFFSKSCR